MKKDTQNIINKNFDGAATSYNKSATIQKVIASKLAKICFKHSIPNGIWADLGSGTGLLAESLEKLHANQNVLRVDNSSKMIEQQQTDMCLVWDLNSGLPSFSERPRLLASNFVLHWLTNPSIRLKEWLSALAPGGWLALAVPIKGSFSEWHEACLKAEVQCTAWGLPSQESLIQSVQQGTIRHNQIIISKESSNNMTSLLKAMVKVGAHTSAQASLSVGAWRDIQKSWQKSNNGNLVLTWHIQLLLVQT